MVRNKINNNHDRTVHAIRNDNNCDHTVYSKARKSSLIDILLLNLLLDWKFGPSKRLDREEEKRNVLLLLSLNCEESEGIITDELFVLEEAIVTVLIRYDYKYSLPYN